MSVFPRILGVVFLAGFQICTVQAQIPVKDLQDLSGPWECQDPNGIHGIFITHSTRMTDSGGGQQTVAWQEISVFVDQRQGGKAEGGYFSPGHHDSRGGADFDGRRLMISFRGISNLSPFNVDIDFDVVAKQWDGYWSLCNSTGKAVLERPHQAVGMSADVFEGDWEGNFERFSSGPDVLTLLQEFARG